MKLRVKIFVGLVIAAAAASLYGLPGVPARQWSHFFVYLLAIVLSSGMKVALPRSEGTMSVNFPFIFLGILQLAPPQAAALAVCSVVAQSRIRVIHGFSLVQVLFNAANVTTATVMAWYIYAQSLPLLHHEFAPALALAAIGYFFSNTLPVALVIAWDSGTNAFANWRQNYVWYLPFYLVGALLAAATNLIEIHFGWMTSLLLIPALYTVYRAYSAQMAIIRDREKHVVEMEALQLRTIEGLAMAIEAKDQNTHRHLMRVRIYVSELGKLMNLEEPVLKALLIAAFLHDIGKLAIPEHIINKPGKLTHDEFEKMKIHPVVGADILERVKFPYPVVPIVRGHHEAWDGSGYPDGLKGEEIPIGARILTAVDCFDALASERPYRKSLPLHEAMAIVKSKAGVQFDPEVVALLEQHYEELEAVARERIEDVEPLKTDLFIARGAAPGAGFESVHPSRNGDDSEPSRAASFDDRQYGSLSLIAAASQEEKAVSELNQLLGSSLSARETCSMSSAHLQRLIPFECFAVYLVSGETVVQHYVDGALASAFSVQAIPMGEGVSGWVAESGRPIVNGNPTVEPNYLQGSEHFTSSSSALSIPLRGTQDEVFGALTVYARRQTAFSRDHLRILQAIQSKFSLALENALRYRTAETDARIDHLTQLWNMRYFFRQVDSEIERSRQTGQSFGMAICDLNSFKAVNDRYGHLTGNVLLSSVAREFRVCCRPADTLARMGGDEFAFLFPAMDEAGAESKLEVLERAVQRASQDLNLDMPVSGSMGIAFYPKDGDTAEALLSVADRGMYKHKRAFYEGQSETLPGAVLSGLSAV